MAEEGTHNESKLIASLRSGSVHAFDALYDMYYRRIYGYCLNFTKAQKIQKILFKRYLSSCGLTGKVFMSMSLSAIIFSA